MVIKLIYCEISGNLLGYYANGKYKYFKWWDGKVVKITENFGELM